jgi:hypothetical protein
MLGTPDGPEQLRQSEGRKSKECWLSAAMCGAARGESIARTCTCSNGRERVGAETLEGLLRPGYSACRVSGPRPSGDRMILRGAAEIRL